MPKMIFEAKRDCFSVVGDRHLMYKRIVFINNTYITDNEVEIAFLKDNFVPTFCSCTEVVEEDEEPAKLISEPTKPKIPAKISRKTV